MTRRALLIVLASSVFGLLAALQIKSVQPAGGTSLDRVTGLAAEVGLLREEKAKQEAAVRLLEQQVAKLQGEKQVADENLAKTKAALDDARRKAGLTDVSGPGLVITINPKTFTQNGVKKIVKAITDEELLLVVNELNAAGAEAISINGQRIIAMSAIRLAGDFVNINRMETAMPYEIKAVGDPVTLEAALRLYGGIVERYGEFYEIKLEKPDRVDVPGYKGEISFRHAEAAAQ